MSKILSIVHSIVFFFIFWIVTIFIVGGARFFAFFVGEAGKEKCFHKGSILWGRILSNLSLMKVKVKGLENIPKEGNFVFTPNHQSYLDTFLLLKYIPCPFKFVIQRKVFQMPFLGAHIFRAGYFSLDTKDRKSSLQTIGKMVNYLKEGGSVLVFPEGKLTEDGEVRKFKRGAAMVIQKSMKRVIPIGINGTFSVFPKNAKMMKFGEVIIRFGKPVFFEELSTDINKESSLELGNRLRELVVDLKNSSD